MKHASRRAPRNFELDEVESVRDFWRAIGHGGGGHLTPRATGRREFLTPYVADGREGRPYSVSM